MRRLLILTALLATACQPMPAQSDGNGTSQTPPPVRDVDTTDVPPPVRVPEETADAASCSARGGEIRRIGRMGRSVCVTPYADAGKRCTDGDQCLGGCRAEANLPPPPSGDAAPGRPPAPPAVTEGRCQADTDPFGCYVRVEDGRGTTICVD